MLTQRSILRISLIVLVGIEVTGTVAAQILEPDTLDWKRYYPLAVGNEWQYADAESGPCTRLTITGVTESDSLQYFVADVEIFWPQPPCIDPWSHYIKYLRYDQARIVINISDLTVDTVSVYDPFELGTVNFYHFDLQSAFGDSVQFGQEEFEYYTVDGGFGLPVYLQGETINTTTRKDFIKGGLWYQSYAADIGFLGGGNLWGPRLKYAKIDGIEYGTKVVLVSTEDPATPHYHEERGSVYPNPSIRSVYVDFALAETAPVAISLFDALGRRIQEVINTTRGPGQYTETVDISTLRSGLYLFRVTVGSTVETHLVTIAH